MLAVLAPLLVFGLVVFVHELGHFLAAKLVGVYAPVFSLGWGTRLAGFKFGETDYRVSWFPVGGFVSMATAADETMSFASQSHDARAGGDALRTDAGVVDVPTNSPGDVPDRSGPRRGFNPVPWDPAATHPFGPRAVPAHRWFESKPLAARLFILLAGVSMNVLLAFAVYTGNFAVRGRAYLPPVVDSVIAGRPAALAGLRRGDSVTAIDGRPVRTWSELVSKVSTTTAGAVTLDVRRGPETVRVVVSPRSADAPDPVTGVRRTVGQIGAYVRPTIVREPLGLGAAFRAGAVATWETGTSVFTVLGGLFGGKVPVSSLGGPVAIARTSVAAARAGVEPLLLLVAFLSVNIAVLNLLPVPVLDGGQVLINVLETLKGRAFSSRARENILRVGLAAVAALFITVMWNDLSRLVGDLLR